MQSSRVTYTRAVRLTRQLIIKFETYSTQTLKMLPESNSFAMNLFRGKLVASDLLPFPKAVSKERLENLEDILAPIGKFFQNEVDAVKHDVERKFDPQVVASLAALGAYGLQVPEEYRGSGLNNSEYARLVSIIGSTDLSVCIHLGAHQSIGFKGILLYGTDEQKSKYLPDLASGKQIAAYCLTEPDAGSDAASIKTTAKRTPDGKYYLLNGTKIWISNGGLANVFTVFAKTAVTVADGSVKDRITAFIVERDFGGASHSQTDDKMGIHASNTVTLYLEDCKVPVENVLGQIGDGFKIAVNILNQGRFGMAAALAGTMHAAIQQTTQHVTQRKQFNRTLNEYQNVQEKLTSMVLRHYVTETMAFVLSGSMDLGASDFQLEAAMSKIYASEAAWLCVDEAIQLHGGIGYMKYAGLERVLRDLRVFRIFEGANDVLRLFVALTGLNFAGKHLTQQSKSLTGKVKLGTDMLKRRIGRPGEGAQLLNLLPRELQEPAKLTAEAIDAFGDASFKILTRYGKKVIDEQFLLIRLANAAIELYAMTCVLSRCAMTLQEHPRPLADHELQLTKLVCLQSSKKVHSYLKELDNKNDMAMYDLMKSISFHVCNHGGIVYNTPLGI